jgi:hypothetical protein
MEAHAWIVMILEMTKGPPREGLYRRSEPIRQLTPLRHYAATVRVFSCHPMRHYHDRPAGLLCRWQSSFYLGEAFFLNSFPSLCTLSASARHSLPSLV